MGAKLISADTKVYNLGQVGLLLSRVFSTEFVERYMKQQVLIFPTRASNIILEMGEWDKTSEGDDFWERAHTFFVKQLPLTVDEYMFDSFKDNKLKLSIEDFLLKKEEEKVGDEVCEECGEIHGDDDEIEEEDWDDEDNEEDNEEEKTYTPSYEEGLKIKEAKERMERMAYKEKLEEALSMAKKAKKKIEKSLSEIENFYS